MFFVRLDTSRAVPERDSLNHTPIGLTINCIRKRGKGQVVFAQAAGIEVSLCGEMAGEPKYTMLLLGLGLRTLSLTPQMIPDIKKIIRSVTLAECEQLAEAALTADSAEEVLESLVEKARPLLPEFFR